MPIFWTFVRKSGVWTFSHSNEMENDNDDTENDGEDMENYNINDMERHALAILEQNNRWDWPSTKRILKSGKEGGRCELATPSLLYHLIVESQKFGGRVLDRFWKQLGKCDERLKENIESLKEETFVSADQSFDVLFRGLYAEDVDFGCVVKMAAEYFTHLGVEFMNPGGKKSGTSTAHSVSEIVSKDTNRLLEDLNKEGDFGKRRQGLLKKLAFKRDGMSCLLTGLKFKFVPFDQGKVYPVLAHIIPNSIHKKSRTMKCIAMFAGATMRNDIMHNLNSIGNAMNIQGDAHKSYDDLEWGIEAKAEGGETKYFFRTVPTDPHSSPVLITLAEGDEIHFGEGSDGELLGKGPLASLCNLQLAIARVLKMSGAADIILQWKDDADDDGCDHPSVTSEEFCDMLDAKLLLSGKAIIV